jgi:hypothetical protein
LLDAEPAPGPVHRSAFSCPSCSFDSPSITTLPTPTTTAPPSTTRRHASGLCHRAARVTCLPRSLQQPAPIAASRARTGSVERTAAPRQRGVESRIALIAAPGRPCTPLLPSQNSYEDAPGRTPCPSHTGCLLSLRSVPSPSGAPAGGSRIVSSAAVGRWFLSMRLQ